MSRSLPPKANSRFLHEQAKDLLKAHKTGSADACNTLRVLKRFHAASDREVLTAEVALHEVQFALALDYGFQSWDALVSHVKAVESELASDKSIVNPESLTETLDSVNEALFFGRPITQARRNEALDWISGRIGAPHSYRGMPAPTMPDLKNGMKVFTGERVGSWASLTHVSGEEGCRVLRQLAFGNPAGEEQYRRAAARIAEIIPKGDGLPIELIGTGFGGEIRARTGIYCCGTCSVSLWRHMAAGGIANSGACPCEISFHEERLADGIRALNCKRDKEGKWKPFPFWYTILVLTELATPEALEELRYAAPLIERSLKRSPGDDKYAQRRHEVAQRAMKMIG